MGKIICDICGTTFSDTEAECPICGCAKDLSAASLVDELMEEELNIAAAAAVRPQKAQKAPVYQEEPLDDDDDYEDEDEDDEDEGDEHKSNAGLVIALVLVVLMLIAVSAFILVKYFLPNVVGPETTAPATVETTEEPTVESTELRIPCESLALTSGGEIILEEEGINWLINVMALPENTTDELIYASSDESVVIVNEQGKLTAVGEGTAVITITCGGQEMKCTVTCDFTEETTAPSEPEETTEPTEPEQTDPPTEPTEPLKDIDLAKAISYTELTFNGPNQGYTFKINGLKNNEVKWSSENEAIVTVDENGNVLNKGKGTTYIVVKYGDQEVKVKINCIW